MGRKHCGKRRNCLLQAISPFSSVCKRLVSQGLQKVSLCGNGLILLNQKLNTFTDYGSMQCFFFIDLNTVTDDHSFKHGCFPISVQYLTTALGRILFSSVVMVLAYQLGGPDSNTTRIIYFCHAFIHFFLCYGLCS